MFFPPGKRGLEIRGNGPRPIVPVDFHDGGRRRHRRHHPPGPQSLRRPQPNWQRTLGHRSTGKVSIHSGVARSDPPSSAVSGREQTELWQRAGWKNSNHLLIWSSSVDLWEKWARWCKHQQQLIFTPGANNGELATDGGANLVLLIQRLAPDFPKLVLTKQWMELFLVGDLASSSLPVLIQPDSCDTARQCCSTLSWLS